MRNAERRAWAVSVVFGEGFRRGSSEMSCLRGQRKKRIWSAFGHTGIGSSDSKILVGKGLVALGAILFGQ